MRLSTSRILSERIASEKETLKALFSSVSWRFFYSWPFNLWQNYHVLHLRNKLVLWLSCWFFNLIFEVIAVHWFFFFFFDLYQVWYSFDLVRWQIPLLLHFDFNFSLTIQSRNCKYNGNLFAQVQISDSFGFFRKSSFFLCLCFIFGPLDKSLLGLDLSQLYQWYICIFCCSAASRKPNETIKIILTTFLGVAFGFLIGVSFPTLSLTKVCKFRSAFSLSSVIFPFFSFPFFFCSHYTDEYLI